MIDGTINKLNESENGAQAFQKYQLALAKNQELYELDDDMLAFTSQSSDVLDALYSDPNIVPALKKMPSSAKTAYLATLLMQSHKPTQVAIKAPEKVTPPAKVPSGKQSGGVTLENLDGDDYLREYRRQRTKR